MGKLVIAVEKSSNGKTGVVSSTYAPIQSCPNTCPFLDKGCYAQSGPTGIHLRRINKEAKDSCREAPEVIAKEEARAIKGLTGKNPLRLHVVGDCKTVESAELLREASKEYTDKHKQPVWTYTHAWREIPRDAWGGISVLASCETEEDCISAMDKGYAASIIKETKFDDRSIKDNYELVPCKEITKGIKCDKCRLCFDDKRLLENKRVIVFFPHGTGMKTVSKTLKEKNNE